MRARMLIALALFWLAAVLTVLLFAIPLLARGFSGIGIEVELTWRFLTLSAVILLVMLGWILPLVAGLRERRRGRV